MGGAVAAPEGEVSLAVAAETAAVGRVARCWRFSGVVSVCGIRKLTAEGRAKRSPFPDVSVLSRGRWEGAWGAYSGAVRPVTEPQSKKLAPLFVQVAHGATFDPLGLWVSWHMLGG